MNRFQSIFNEINKYINYMLYDDYIIFSSNYIQCMNKILCVLKNTLSKIQDIYLKYILHPKIKVATATASMMPISIP